MDEEKLYCPHRENMKKNGHALKVPLADGKTALLCRACVNDLKLEVSLTKAIGAIVQAEMTGLLRAIGRA